MTASNNKYHNEEFLQASTMIQHHPDDNLLLEFANGTLDTAQAIAIKTHLHFCTKCQQNVQRLEQTGGAMLSMMKPETLAKDGFDKLMSSLDELAPEATEATTVEQSFTPKLSKEVDELSQHYGPLPNVVIKMIDNQSLKWKHVNSSLQTRHLVAGQTIHQVSLQRINAGGIAPKHDHRGTEMTVVLKGSFSDEQGIYQKGDFIVKEPGDVHQPISAKNEDCLCLSVESAPVKLTGFFGRLINPFIKHYAA